MTWHNLIGAYHALIFLKVVMTKKVVFYHFEQKYGVIGSPQNSTVFFDKQDKAREETMYSF